MISNGSETNVEKKLETNGSSETMTEPDSTAASNSISPSSQDDVKRISEFFETNASAIEKWLRDVAPEQVIAQISNVVSKRKPSCEREHRSSVTSELYQQWLSSSTSPTKKVSWSISIEWLTATSWKDDDEFWRRMSQSWFIVSLFFYTEIESVSLNIWYHWWN